ncbi:MAG: YdeI/OmpD-associated family protein [Alphaproteobacteria bacterium]|nr:YdeI/OmpD-associated family protein [Alphaproteobacteria bacterium]
MAQNFNLLEKLQFKEGKNILIQGLPSSFEKQFIKLNFVKDITPLLRTRKIDFGIVFVISQQQLTKQFKAILPCLKEHSNLWMAFPKHSSKLISDLNLPNSWDIINTLDFEILKMIDLDNVWGGYKIVPKSMLEHYMNIEDELSNKPAELTYKVTIPFELEKLFDRNDISKQFFCSLTESEQKGFVDWIYKAKKKVTQEKRIITILEKLRANRRTPY